MKNECKCLQLHHIDKYTSYFITKETFPTQSSNVHHLFSCDISVNGKTILYYHTKKSNENQVGPSLELILLFQNVSGSLTKVICNVANNEEKSANTNTTVVEVCPKKETETLVMHQGIPEDWQMT